jgi:sugar lactone lactonase YvrE
LKILEGSLKRGWFYLFMFCLLNTNRLAIAQSGDYFFSTVAGLAGVSGAADGTNSTARFYSPGGIACDATGNVFVADILNHTIRKLTSIGTNWVVTTIAGQAGAPPDINDGTNNEARFDRPNYIAIDQAGDLFVTDHYNHTIRKVTPDGTNWIVTTIAGLAGIYGNDDGTNSQARFWSPTGIAVDNSNRLYVVDTANFTIRQITPIGTNWVVSTIAGLPLSYGFMDGTNADAEFDYPYGITVGLAGQLFVTDFGNNSIRQITQVGSNWVVTTIAGKSRALGSADGAGALATFNHPNGICADPEGNVFVSDQSNDTIRELSPSGNQWAVTTVAGKALQASTSDGFGNSARFKHPWSVGVEAEGALWVSDYGNQTIRRGIFMPWLRIAKDQTKLVLSWSTQASGFTLETSASPEQSDSWVPFPHGPITNGAYLLLADQPTNSPVFYRLRKR